MAGPSNWQIAFQLTLCLLLVGCGFQLKGTVRDDTVSSLSGKTLAVASAQPRSELTAAMTQQLDLDGAVLGERNASELVLRIGEESFQQRNLSLTAQARSAEVELTLSTVFSLRRGNDILVDNAEAVVVRQFLNDPRNVVGKTEELRLIRDEMRHDLAAQISRRIGHSLNN